MATEKQIAANRRNAHRSTGPRTGAGKKRASRNSYRHGLAVEASSDADLAPAIERLARTIAGPMGNPVALEWARTIAHAEFDLAQVQRVKLAVISREIGDSDLQASTETDCSTEAPQRPLAELIKLDRYQHRASMRRARAIATLMDLRTRFDR